MKANASEKIDNNVTLRLVYATKTFCVSFSYFDLILVFFIYIQSRPFFICLFPFIYRAFSFRAKKTIFNVCLFLPELHLILMLRKITWNLMFGDVGNRISSKQHAIFKWTMKKVSNLSISKHSRQCEMDMKLAYLFGSATALKIDQPIFLIKWPASNAHTLEKS